MSEVKEDMESKGNWIRCTFSEDGDLEFPTVDSKLPIDNNSEEVVIDLEKINKDFKSLLPKGSKIDSITNMADIFIDNEGKLQLAVILNSITGAISDPVYGNERVIYNSLTYTIDSIINSKKNGHLLDEYESTIIKYLLNHSEYMNSKKYIKRVLSDIDCSIDQIKLVDGYPEMIDANGNKYGLHDIAEFLSIKSKIKKYSQQLINSENGVGKNCFDEKEVPDLLSLIIEANRNPITKRFLNESFEMASEEGTFDKKHTDEENLYSRMHNIRKDIALFFGCKSDELILPYSKPHNNTTIISVLEKQRENFGGEDKVIIGDTNFSERKMYSLSSDKIEYIIGDLDLSGYQGEINSKLTVTGNVIMDELTKISNLDQCELYCGGSLIGVDDPAKIKALKNVVCIEDLSNINSKSLRSFLAHRKETYKNKSNSQNEDNEKKDSNTEVPSQQQGEKEEIPIFGNEFVIFGSESYRMQQNARDVMKYITETINKGRD